MHTSGHHATRLAAHRSRLRAAGSALGADLREVQCRDIAPIVVLTVASLVGTALSPLLQAEGMLLALMSPRLVFLGVAAHQNAAVPFVVLATLRLCLADPFHYRIGRRHGPAVLDRLGWLGRRFQRIGSGGWLVLLVIALRPIGRHVMWAGTRRLNPVAVGAVDVISTAVFCVAVKAGVDRLPWN